RARRSRRRPARRRSSIDGTGRSRIRCSIPWLLSHGCQFSRCWIGDFLKLDETDASISFLLNQTICGWISPDYTHLPPFRRHNTACQEHRSPRAALNPCDRAVMNVDWLPDEIPLRSLCPKMVCTACGLVGADVRPDWSPHTNKRPS